MGKKLLERFMKKKVANDKSNRIQMQKKVEKNKTYELYAKWKGYDNQFNS